MRTPMSSTRTPSALSASITASRSREAAATPIAATDPSVAGGPRSPLPPSLRAWSPSPAFGGGNERGSRSDEAVDLAVAEQPLPANFDQFVLVCPAGADLWPGRAVLDNGPVGAHARARAVQRDRDVGHQMNSAGPLVARLRADVAGQLGDRRAAGRAAESGV